MRRRLIVGVTGASGAVLALETLRQLADTQVETHLVVTAGARMTIAHELGPDGLGQMTALADHTHSPRNLAAPIASGSFRTEGMIVVPCSMRSLAAMAHGLGDNLLTRAADVVLKERRRLVVAPREAPLHEGHLEAMLRLARAPSSHRRCRPSMQGRPRWRTWCARSPPGSSTGRAWTPVPA